MRWAVAEAQGSDGLVEARKGPGAGGVVGAADAVDAADAADAGCEVGALAEIGVGEEY